MRILANFLARVAVLCIGTAMVVAGGDLLLTGEPGDFSTYGAAVSLMGLGCAVVAIGFVLLGRMVWRGE